MYFLLTLTLSACSSSTSWIGHSQEIISRFCKNNECNFELIATGYGGSETGQLKLFCMTIDCRQKMSLECARLYIVQFCEEFLQEVNANEELKPELYNYPCTNENLDIILAFEDIHHKSFQAPYIAIIILGKGKIHYSSSDENGKYIDILSENYEEALKIYHDYMNQIPKS